MSLGKGNYGGITCPNCGSVKTPCTDSRLSFGIRWRARKCLDCNEAISSVEVIFTAHEGTRIPSNAQVKDIIFNCFLDQAIQKAKNALS